MRVVVAAAMLGFGFTVGCSAVAEQHGSTLGEGGGGGSGGSAPACVYPAGPYGRAVGDTLAPTLKWQGYLEGASQSSEVLVTDYHDCDGSKGIDAVLFDVSAGWCGACEQEAVDLPAEMTSWKGKGIRVATLMIQDADGNPATVATAEAWRAEFKLATTATLADPDISLVEVVGGGIGLPDQIVVDPRTMKITSTQEGYSGDYSAVLSVAAKNHQP